MILAGICLTSRGEATPLLGLEAPRLVYPRGSGDMIGMYAMGWVCLVWPCVEAGFSFDPKLRITACCERCVGMLVRGLRGGARLEPIRHCDGRRS